MDLGAVRVLNLELGWQGTLDLKLELGFISIKAQWNVLETIEIPRSSFHAL
jgi:hypothetical protein